MKREDYTGQMGRKPTLLRREKAMGTNWSQVMEGYFKVSLISKIKHPTHASTPVVKMARWPKTPGELERCIGEESVRTIRRERELRLWSVQ